MWRDHIVANLEPSAVEVDNDGAFRLFGDSSRGPVDLFLAYSASRNTSSDILVVGATLMRGLAYIQAMSLMRSVLDVFLTCYRRARVLRKGCVARVEELLTSSIHRRSPVTPKIAGKVLDPWR